MNDASMIAAEKRHAASIGVPGTLVIDGASYPARIYVERRSRYVMDGGTVQTRKLSAVVLTSRLAKAKIIDASDQTRSIEITHKETGSVYRIDTGGVNLSPMRVFWTLRASQPTTT